jgi:hypothetical protein
VRVSTFTARVVAYAVLTALWAGIVFACLRFYPWGPIALGAAFLFVALVRVVVWAIHTVEDDWRR